MIRSGRYRIGQVASLLRARRHPPDNRPARDVLPDRLFELFRRMPAEDQRHGLEVMARLRDQGHDEPLLLHAALLHDVGKADAGVRLVHRVARVALRGLAPPLWRWLSAWPTGWRRPFWAVAHHAERGAVWVESEGGDPLLVDLIRHHELDAPREWEGRAAARYHHALADVDARC